MTFFNSRAPCPSIRVLIIEPSAQCCRRFARIVQQSPCLELAGAYPSFEWALVGAADGAAPDVVLLDVRGLGEPEYRHAIESVRAHWPGTKQIVIVDESQNHLVKPGMAWGVGGFLAHDAPDDDVATAINASHRGGTPISPDVLKAIVGRLRSSRSGVDQPAGTSLSPREVGVLQLLADGQTYAEIAENLCISINTVRNYVRSAYVKLDARTKASAVRKALGAGLIT